MNSKTKNALIGGLLAIVFVMAVGYAAFTQALTINGTASITSTWDVEITDISVAEEYGTGKDQEEYTDVLSSTSARFGADLVSPGDYVEYTVTVKNNGTIDAEVEAITFSFDDVSETSPIGYSYSDIVQGTQITAGNEIYFTVKVEYKNYENQSQPDVTSKTLNMTITCKQAS